MANPNLDNISPFCQSVRTLQNDSNDNSQEKNNEV